MISHVLIYLCLASGIKGAFCVNVTLLPSSADVVENGKINLTCYNDEQKGDVAVWTNSNGLAESVTIYNNSKCTVAGFLANTSLYTTYCMGGGSFVLQLNNVDRRMHDVSWICAYRFEDGIQVKSNNASVYVIVPVKYIKIIELNEDKSNTVSVIEKHQTTLKYNVSFSRPSPNVSCFLCMNDNSITLHVGNFIPNRWKYEMVFTFNRTFNGWMIHCSASNMQNVTVTSKRLNLNVLYPPSVPSLLLYDGTMNVTLHSGNLSVMENDSFIVKCSTRSNPLPSYSWNSPYMKDNASLAMKNVKRNQEGTYTCHSWNEMHPSHGNAIRGSSHASFNLNVLCPPNIIPLHNQTIVERSIISTPCAALASKHFNLKFEWTREKDNFKTNTKMLLIPTVKWSDSTQYTCTIFYTLIPTVGMRRTGNISASFYLNVLFSPRPSPLEELSETVSSARNNIVTLKFTSIAYPQPGPSGFTWYHWNGSDNIQLINSDKIWIFSCFLQTSLTIRNVTNADYGKYLLRIDNTVGVFEQIFSLEPYVTDSGANENVDSSHSSNTKTLLGVGFGTFITTLTIVGSCLVIYRHVRLRRNCRQTSRNDPCQQTENIQSSPQYETIDNGKKESNQSNQYSQLQAPHEQEDVTRERHADKTVEHTETDRNIQDYTNIRI